MNVPPCICPKNAPWAGHPSEQRVVLRMLPSPGPVVALEEPASGPADVDSWVNPATAYHTWSFVPCWQGERS